MKSLIVATGSSKIILTRLIPTLREKGKYDGDVLVIDYGVINYYKHITLNNQKFVDELNKDNKVSVIQPVQKQKNIFLDRMYVTYEYLLSLVSLGINYDVVMCVDGNDVIFHGDINPLLKKAEKKLCYVKEHFSNKLKIWNDFYPRKFIQENFMSIGDNPIINGGMIVGPLNSVLKLYNRIFEMVKKYGDEPSDQVYLDILIYFYKFPSQEVGQEWNYTHAVIGQGHASRIPLFKNDKAFMVEDNTKEVFIEHRTGTGHKYWTSKEGLELLQNDKPVPMLAEYLKIMYIPNPNVKDNWLFPKIQKVTEPNWLFGGKAGN